MKLKFEVIFFSDKYIGSLNDAAIYFKKLQWITRIGETIHSMDVIKRNEYCCIKVKR